MHFTCYLLLICFLLATSNSKYYNIPSSDGGMRVRASKDLQPWLGVLEVRDRLNVIESITSTILIATNWSIASARDIVPIDKPIIIQRTKVTFFVKGKFAVECAVLRYVIHPEYIHNTANTLALVSIRTNHNVSKLLWKPISYTKSKYIQRKKEFYFIGFIENRQRLEQNIETLQPVNMYDCKKFYREADLDSKSFWPQHCMCFKSAQKLESCVYDAGSALAVKNDDDWELIGLSTYGPGCSLPSRFIEIYPYVKWIDMYTESLKKKIIYSRRFDWDLGPIEEGFERKLYVLLTDETITLYLDSTINQIRLQGGKCGQDSEVVYSERDKFSGTYSVYYAVTIFDEVVESFTCITSEVSAAERSKAHMIVQKGFGELVDIQQFVKPIPITDKIHLYEELYQIFTIPVRYDPTENATQHDTYTLWFKFDVRSYGDMIVRFYAKKKPGYAYG